MDTVVSYGKLSTVKETLPLVLVSRAGCDSIHNFCSCSFGEPQTCGIHFDWAGGCCFCELLVFFCVFQSKDPLAHRHPFVPLTKEEALRLGVLCLFLFIAEVSLKC